jgi:hypothetical protein
MMSLADRWDPTTAAPDAMSFTFKDWLCEQSRLVAVLDSRLSQKDIDTRRRGFEKRRLAARAKPYFTPPGLDLLRGLPLFESYLRRIALVCNDAKVPLVFMTQPTIWKVDQTKEEEEALWMSSVPTNRTHLDPKTCVGLMDAYNDAIRRVAREHKLACVDLAGAVPKDLEHFYDDAHLTAKGNRKIADTVLQTVWPLPTR